MKALVFDSLILALLGPQGVQRRSDLARVALRHWPHDPYTIPVGAEVIMSPYLAHRLPQY